ncbi:MAG TPA: trimeric intracellular cation channel family protein [Stenotrophobium sp.]|nr:trimeric intracellular cation channel family protein [Stenotrophobium sp.]
MTLPHFFDLLGVAVFAVSGALAAGRKSLDLMGVMVIAIVTAIGGGTLRDLLLDRHPVFWVASPDFLSVSLASALLTLVYVRWLHPPDRLLLVADAFGLALFTISGARIAQQMQVEGVIVVVMGVITGVFGGVLRDVLCAEIPMILRKGSIYATTAIAGASVFVLMDDLGLHRMGAAITGMAVIALLRLGAIAWNWSLPVFSLADRGDVRR